MKTQKPLSIRRFVSASIPTVSLIALALVSGCRSFEPATGAPSFERVIDATEQVLKEHFNHAKAVRSSGHVFAYGPPRAEGSHVVRTRVDVYVMPEHTGYYMPRVTVRKYYDMAEPDLEIGDFADFRNVNNNPYNETRWTPIHHDRRLEEILRKAILERLKGGEASATTMASR